MSRMVWGPCTWYLFHTLAHKIKDEHFDEMKRPILDNIFKICESLPCPDCTKHATSKLKTLNTNVIKSKDDLKRILMEFHNFVNARKGKKIFTVEDLNSKYHLAKTNIVIKYFVQVWEKQYNNPKLMAEGFQRGLMLKTFKQWITQNFHKFNS